MCPPKTIAAMQDRSVCHRSFLKFGLEAVATAAALSVEYVRAAPLRPTSFSNVMDLTHLLAPISRSFLASQGLEVRCWQHTRRMGFTRIRSRS
ncbi:MAG: hypothetical protein GFH27_549283n177 [Chloroflexi bacterium AL-W]|nr:hypothetical protein [Chloroflexi bacterium AL-N1]NOK64702.1 hypothetical protein [Chloroflexi bacterium AL-N10]NOK75943.1 hypothetical protein [Chloroflexi bacterium AL-N5]NOK80298.1 hypothetical protein [Chloroflexi bacterium AL-W]NOK86811.1 hypothetical protein [Chloroflexi bacterium AL-N15]